MALKTAGGLFVLCAIVLPLQLRRGTARRCVAGYWATPSSMWSQSARAKWIRQSETAP